MLTPTSIDGSYTTETGSSQPTASYNNAPANTQGNNVTVTTTGNYSTGNITDIQKYSDGSIGRLNIPRINVNIKVYEGETLENMKYGGAHFEHTSAWDGNIAIAAHNSGSAGYFKDLKKLEIGDTITYETQNGKRTYEVTSTHVIADNDYSLLSYSYENKLTLITCENGVATQRYAVVAAER